MTLPSEESTGPMRRVAIAGLFHETNTFAAARTDRAAFQAKGWFDGEPLRTHHHGTRTVVGGFLDGLRQAGLAPVATFGAYATPSGLVPRDTFGTILDRLDDAVRRARGVDAVLLELHGALVVDGVEDPEQVACRAVAEAAGGVPLVAVTDLHANMTAQRLASVDALTGYRTNPHVDTYETGVDAVRLLQAIAARGEAPAVAHGSVPVIAAPIAQPTAEVPLLRLLGRARELERRYRLADVTVHGGYAYADVPYAGVSFTASGFDGIAGPQEAVAALVDLAWRVREEFAVELPPAKQAFAEAVQLAEQGGPVGLADTGDNIGGGSAGDATWLLAEALESSAATGITVHDPDAVARAERTGAGGRLSVSLGAWSSPLAGEPVEVDAEVEWVGDGSFTNAGPMATGARVAMGPTARLRIGSVRVIAQSRPHQPNDPELFRAAGVDPADCDVIILKGAAALRAGWTPVTRAFVDAGTPGVTDCRLERLPYVELAERVWPLAEVGAKRAEVVAPVR